MSRDGLVEINETQQTARRISQRESDELTRQPPVPEKDTGAAERIMEHLEAAHDRQAARRDARELKRDVAAKPKASRLQFTEEERASPELDPYIRKAEKAAGKLDRAQATVPKKKKIVQQRTFDEVSGKAKTKLTFEETEKPIGKGKNLPSGALSLPAKEVGVFVHNKIHSVEKENVGVEGAHKTEKAAERLSQVSRRAIRRSSRSRKLKPYRAAAKAEKAATKANADFLYQKALHDNPQLASNPVSRLWQKQRIKRQYAKALRTGAAGSARTAAEAVKNSRKAAKKAKKETKRTLGFIARHPAGVAIAVLVLVFSIVMFSGLSSCSSMLTGGINSILGTSYTSEDVDLIAVERHYEGMESDLQSRVNRIEQDYPGYDEYRYDFSMIGHNPHELASYLTAKYQSYTLSDVRGELSQIFEQQYTLTLTREVETRYREETHTETYTDEDGNTYTETVTEQVPYDYYILNVKLTNTPLSSFLPDKLNEEQRKMYAVYLETSGNKPLIFGGGSPGGGESTDLSGVHFVNGKRPGNTAVVDIAKRQEGNVGGYPYWSWYGFNGRVEWCACFVSWCYHKAGLSEPRFAACQSQGVAWFTARGQWGARGYKDIAPGDAIFFDWDLDGSADHVGIVIGRDSERVYTVEGNSGDACKIKSYSLNYECIKGYGLMNWD
ncbi:CHAP domain-containing protein [Ihubacter massiliensis]|uniref:CD1108 family mobile element protein n=1 Tax=Ihubacter massiliensis TaxID=1852367 RepID=UPI002096C219|nr:CHAP domain-containing protein [Ihubacter massiliensis]MCO7122431.1 CHAP domain-containing protein [Ihubacter massiliensis]